MQMMLQIKKRTPCLFLDTLAFLIQFLALQAKYSTCVWHTWPILFYVTIIKANAAQIKIPLGMALQFNSTKISEG